MDRQVLDEPSVTSKSCTLPQPSPLGKFWACNDPDVSGVTECVGTFELDGETTDREWVNQQMNFDNIATALLTLYEVWFSTATAAASVYEMAFIIILALLVTNSRWFQVAGLEMWLDVMYAGMDAPEEIGLQVRHFIQSIQNSSNSNQCHDIASVTILNR